MSMFEEKVDEKTVAEDVIVSEPIKQETKNNNEGFLDMLDEDFVDTDKIVEGDVVEGKVIAINESYIFVSLGGKHEAHAEVEEYKNKAGKLKIKEGDKLKGFVVKKTDSEIVISKSLNRKYVDKSFLNNAYREKIPVKAKVINTIKGGFSVEILGTRAFCPFAQADIRFVSNPASMVGNYYEFLITEISADMRNIIVSRRILLEDEINKQREEVMATLNVGDVVQGKVSRLADFGAFIDLGGVDGLLHVSQISWIKIDTPSEVLEQGDDIQVKIINIDGEKISLSVKALQENPLEKALNEIQVGDVVDCRILRNESFGSFCEIRPGVEGLIPISEMVHIGRLTNPSEMFSIGDLVTAQVIRTSKKEKKISLSVKALKPDPWEHIEEHLKEGEDAKGTIDGITNFGIFVRLNEGLIGLLPKSKLFRSKTKYTDEDLNKEIDVRVAHIDKGRKRISLELQGADYSPPMRGFEQTHVRERSSRNDWRKYAVTKQEVPEDNPFSDL